MMHPDSGHGGRIIDLDDRRVDGHRVDGFEKGTVIIVQTLRNADMQTSHPSG